MHKRKDTVLVLAALMLTTAPPCICQAGNNDSYAEQRTQYWQSAPELKDSELDSARRAELSMELHNLQLQIERFSVDHRIGDEPGEIFYPLNLSLLVTGACCEEHGPGGSYMEPGLYPNPWSASSESELNAMQVSYGWTEQTVGNFSYLQQFDDSGRVISYVLIGWGPDAQGGLDIDGDGRPDGAQLLLSNGAFRGKDGWVYAWDDALEKVQLSYWENGRQLEILWRREMDE
jgi:hypothetical protein